jgi:hypothetical protein
VLELLRGDATVASLYSTALTPFEDRDVVQPACCQAISLAAAVQAHVVALINGA